MLNKLAIFGTSGFAYEVADIAYALGVNKIVLLTSDEGENIDARITTLPESQAERLYLNGYKFAMGMGEPVIRKKIYQRYQHFDYPNLIHPNATLGYLQARMINESIGNIITAGVVFTNNITIGNFGVFNLNATVGHDCIIGDYVSIMPSVNISGNVKVGDCVFVGVGAVILQGTSQLKLIIGKNAIVGAASLVTKNVDENLTVFGVPARRLRK